MEKLLSRLVALALLLAVTEVVRAAADSYLYGVHENFTHGVADFGACWMELPMQMYKGYTEGTPGIETAPLSHTLGGLRGVYNGVIHTVGRCGWGVVQALGCWAANPADNAGMQMVFDAEYAWQMGEKKHFWWPQARAGFEGLGARLERGAANLFGSPAELLGQPRKAVTLDGWGAAPAGIGKGIWYSASRAVGGAADLLLILVPGPTETYGVPFAEGRAWSALMADYCSMCRVERDVCGCPPPMAPTYEPEAIPAETPAETPAAN